MTAALEGVSSRPRVRHTLQCVPDVRDRRQWTAIEERVNPVTLDRRAGLREQLRECFGHALVILARRRLHIWASENGGHVTSLGFGDDPEVTQIALVPDEHGGGTSARRQPLHVVDESPRALEARAVRDGEHDEEAVGPLHLVVRAGLARVLEHRTTCGLKMSDDNVDHNR